MLRNLEKSPSKKHNITLDRNYRNAIGSSKPANEKTKYSILTKWQTFHLQRKLLHIILRDIRLWEQLMRLESVFIKNEIERRFSFFNFSMFRKMKIEH